MKADNLKTHHEVSLNRPSVDKPAGVIVDKPVEIHPLKPSLDPCKPCVRRPGYLVLPYVQAVEMMVRS